MKFHIAGFLRIQKLVGQSRSRTNVSGESEATLKPWRWLLYWLSVIDDSAEQVELSPVGENVGFVVLENLLDAEERPVCVWVAAANR